jgi:hypothetical protein
VQPALTKEMLEFVVQKIETYLGVNFWSIKEYEPSKSIWPQDIT